jgi:hypothetical protein
MHTWTEEPIKAIWHDLRFLSRPINVERLLLRETKSKRSQELIWDKFSAQKVSNEISACVRQSDEYFSASRSVSLETKPLLLYYGVLCLSKAVILSNNPHITISDLKFHGLYASKKECPGEKWSLINESVCTNDGVFTSFCKSIEGITIEKGKELMLKDLLPCIPDICETVKRIYDLPSNCFCIYSPRNVKSTEIKFIRFDARKEDIEKHFPEFEFKDFSLEFPGFNIPENCTSFGIVKGSMSGDFCVKKISLGLSKSLPILFACSFILSDIVRYKPVLWNQALQGGFYGDAHIVEKVCNLIERQFPHQSLQCIWNEEFTYGVPAMCG